jgi:hypothetical protein
MQSSGEILSRERESMSYRSSCLAKAGHPVFQRLLGKRSGVPGILDRPVKPDDDIGEFARVGSDCFAEPGIGRRFARTRWLAMTARGNLERFSET